MAFSTRDKWGTPKNQDDIVKADLPDHNKTSRPKIVGLALTLQSRPVNINNLTDIIYNAMRMFNLPQRFCVMVGEVGTKDDVDDVNTYIDPKSIHTVTQKIPNIQSIPKKELSERMAKIVGDDESVVGMQIDVKGDVEVYRIKDSRYKTEGLVPYIEVDFISSYKNQ